MQGLGVNAVGHECRTNTVSGHVAHEKVEEFVAVREDDTEVTAIGTRGAVVGLDRNIVLHQAARRKGLLDARSKGQFGFNFPLALFKQGVGFAELLLDALPCADVSYDKQRVILFVGSMNGTPAIAGIFSPSLRGR